LMSIRVTAVIVAGGRGRRFGEVKQLAILAGRPVLERTLQAFQDHPEVDRMVLVMKADSGDADLLGGFGKLDSVVPGGPRRQDSVAAGFAAVKRGAADVVLVHDAVRPLVSRPLISRVIQAAGEEGAAVPIIPLEDTIKRMEAGMVRGTADRDRLGRAQTPQGFRYEVLAEALDRAARDGFTGTDEAALVERLGSPVIAVQGDRCNLKITFPEDLKTAEALLED